MTARLNLGHGSRMLRRHVFSRDAHVCMYCAQPLRSTYHPPGEPLRPGNRTVDHLVPTARGGQTVASNLVAACRICNVAKADLSVADFAASSGRVRGRLAGFRERLAASGVDYREGPSLASREEEVVER